MEPENSQNMTNSEKDDPDSQNDDDLLNQEDQQSEEDQGDNDDEEYDYGSSDEDISKSQENAEKKAENGEKDPMSEYQKKEAQILQWCKSHPGQQWTDASFPCDNKQFYKEVTAIPKWGVEFKNLEWKRPHEVHKDPKFMIIEEDKNVRYVDCDAKQGVIAESWFIGALTILSAKSDYIEKLVVEKQYFDKGFVAFQFFKNGQWIQVIVDTLLPYEKDSNSRTSVYCCCSNPQEFWISLMEKAYVKLHKSYEHVCAGNILEGLVDLTGGVSEGFDITSPEIRKQIEGGLLWNNLLTNFHQKFYIGCINFDEKKSAKTADQGQQGILENHYYSIIDLREFPKENLKLVRIRNPWGSDGVWNGAFCEDSDDWDKHRSLKEQLRNVFKTKKSDGTWWMNFGDWCQQFNRIFVAKIFPQNWEMYSIQGKWVGKSNGGRCPPRSVYEKVDNKEQPEYLQLESDDRWFNNPQYRVKITKDTKMYISLMQQDEKLNHLSYLSCNFMVVQTKSKMERIWERPDEADIITESNPLGNISNQREVTEYLTLKKFQGKNFGTYMIIPNIVDIKQKDILKKDEKRIFFLRIFASEVIDVTEMPETLETTVEGQWTETTAGGKRRLEGKQNPNWCKNPQYFLNFAQPTQLKIILRKGVAKKAKQWKVGMTIARFDTGTKLIEKVEKKGKNAIGNNIQKLLQQTNQYLEPPKMDSIERKLFILPQEKFKESTYSNEEVSALYFKWNPTEGPFIIIPSVDGEGKTVSYKLTIYSNNPIDLKKLDEYTNNVLIGRWEKDLSAGGCHLYEKEKEPSQRTWAQNPKYWLQFKHPQTEEQKELKKPANSDPITQAKIKITLAIAEKNWKKQNPNTVGGMIGIYLLQKRDTKLTYSEDIVVKQTNFLPTNINTLECSLGTEKEMHKNGYVIMPSTYQSKIHGSFILSVKSDQPFQLIPLK